MKCPGCGASLPMPVASNNNAIAGMFDKNSKDKGAKLKSIRPVRTRPDSLRKSGITRGGRFASD